MVGAISLAFGCWPRLTHKFLIGHTH